MKIRQFDVRNFHLFSCITYICDVFINVTKWIDR
jgi:hypothetical protein